MRRILIVAAVMAAALMQTLDSTITNVALPTIQGNLGADQDEGTWIVTAYTIAAIVIIPLTPWLQNRFGRRNYFVASIAGFTLASIVCGASSDLPMLISARVVQGAFGGGLLATAQSILRDTFSPRQLGLSQGIFAMGALAIIIDWRWAFHSVILGAGQTLSNPAVRLFLRGGTRAELSDLVNAQAAILAYGDATMAIAVVCFACVPLVLLMRKATVRREAALPIVKPAGAQARSIGRGKTDVKAA